MGATDPVRLRRVTHRSTVRTPTMNRSAALLCEAPSSQALSTRSRNSIGNAIVRPSCLETPCPHSNNCNAATL